MRWKPPLVLLLLLAAPTLRAQELLIHAAASLSESVKELAALHEERTGVKVRSNLGASSMLARQVLEGAPGDLFFSADEAKMDQLAKAKLIVEGSRRSLLSGSLVVVVASDSKLELASSADLAGDSVKSVALADPDAVPAGIYAKAHLRKIGAWSRVLPKVVPTENVRAALAAVESGNVDAAIVYATDARVSKRVRVAWAVPPEQAPDISYPVAILSGTQHRAQADAFLAFLCSDDAKTIFEGHGFVVRR